MAKEPLNLKQAFGNFRGNRRSTFVPQTSPSFEVRGNERSEPNGPIDTFIAHRIGDPEGQLIKIRLAPDAHKTAQAVENFFKKKHLCELPKDLKAPYPILMANSLTETKEPGVFTAPWFSIVAKDPSVNPVYHGLTASISKQTTSKRDARTGKYIETPVLNAEGVGVYRVTTILPEKQVIVSMQDKASHDALRAAVENAVAHPPIKEAGLANRAALVEIHLKDGEDDVRSRFTVSAYGGKDKDGTILVKSVDDMVKEVIETISEKAKSAGVSYDDIVAKGLKVGIIPSSNMFIGGKAAQKMESDLALGHMDGSAIQINATKAKPLAPGHNESVFNGYSKATITLAFYADRDGNPTTDACVMRFYVEERVPGVALSAINTPMHPEASREWYKSRKERGAQLEIGEKVDADAPAADEPKDALPAPAEDRQVATADHEIEDFLAQQGGPESP